MFNCVAEGCSYDDSSMCLIPVVNLMSFDEVSSASEKLTHPTAQRPKMPGKRLPGHRGHSVSIKYTYA